MNLVTSVALVDPVSPLGSDQSTLNICKKFNNALMVHDKLAHLAGFEILRGVDFESYAQLEKGLSTSTCKKHYLGQVFHGLLWWLQFGL